MESPMLDNKNVEVTINTSSSSSNQFIPDNLELPDDTFRMSLDDFSMIGENVTIGREVSVDSSVAGNPYTPTIELHSPLPTPDSQTPDNETPDLQTPDIKTPDVKTPTIETPDSQTPDIGTPNVHIPNIETPESQTPNIETPDVQTPDIENPVQSPDIETPDVQTPPPENKTSPPIIETPKLTEIKTEIRRPQTLLQLSLSKKSDNDLFVKPSPVAELMSPARMLQFEVEATSATPTMKRAAVDFDFFNKHNFEKYFVESEPKQDPETPGDGSTYKETPVIVKADTVRHEIGYGVPKEGTFQEFNKQQQPEISKRLPESGVQLIVHSNYIDDIIICDGKQLHQKQVNSTTEEYRVPSTPKSTFYIQVAESMAALGQKSQ